MDRQAFKQRMQNLKSYREDNPGKGYWDWKVEAFADGGQTGDPSLQAIEQRAWLNNWLKNRSKQMSENIDFYSNQTRYGSDMDRIHVSPFFFQDKEENASKIIQEQLQHANNTAIYDYREPWVSSNKNIPNRKEFLKMNSNVQGAYHKKYGQPNTISISPIATDRSVILHELSHSTQDKYSIQSSKIDDILKKYEKENNNYDKYYDNPDEIYSRMNQFRYDNNIKPEDIITEDQIEQWKDSSIDNEFINRYSTNTLLDLLNSVAYTSNKRVQRIANGGEIGDPEKERFYQATGRSSSGRPLEEGLKPVFSLEDAANMTPIGDAISAKDAYDAVKNKDWLGAGLAASAMIPFIPNVYRSLKSKISREVPTVTRSFQRQVDANDLRRDLENNNRRRVLEEYSDQRNRTYELLNTPEARRRAQIIDRKYGTEYNKVYDDLTKEYEDINSYVNLPEPNFVSNKKDYANIDPSKSKIINLSTDNIRTAEDYPKGLIRHEIGHYVDEKAYPGGVPNNAYLRQLGKPSKYRSFSEVEHMFPDKDRAKSIYEYLRRPTEKKSIMNQFDEYLMNTLTPSTYPTNTKQFRQVIESAPDLYNNMKMLLKIHTKPSVLYKDFLTRPLVNKINKNKNQEIV